MTAAMNQLHRIVAGKIRQGPRIQFQANIEHRRRLALHDRTTAQMRLDVDIMLRHHANQGLTQPRRRLGTQIGLAHETCRWNDSDRHHR